MPDTNYYKRTLEKLDGYYKLASESSDKPSFYKYLYNYIELIVKDKNLFFIANILWITKYVTDHPTDTKLSEIVTNLSDSKNVELAWHTFKQIMKEENKDTRLYYSWLLLSSVFYAQYDMKSEEITIPEYDAMKINESVGREVSVEEIKEANVKLKDAFKSLDFKDMPFNHDNFTDALNIFHTEFRGLINEEELASDDASEQEPAKAKLEIPANLVHEVSLRLNGKLLTVYIGTARSVSIRKFKTKKSNIYKAYSALQQKKGKALSKEEMGIERAKSEVDDIVKSLNLDEALSLTNFIDVDMKNQTLKIPLKTEITSENLAILLKQSIEKD